MNKFSKFPAEVICELHPLFKGLLWVAAARSTDETRQALQLIHVERNKLTCHIVATDGRRLHHHEFDPGLFDDDIPMLDPGDYEVITKTPKLIVIAPAEDFSGNYPNWRAVVPDDKTVHSEVIDARFIGKFGIRTGVLIGVDFATQAIGFGCGRKTSDSVLVEFASTGGGKGPMVIEHDLGKAIVMPMSMGADSSDEERKSPKSDAEATPVMTQFESRESDPDALPGTAGDGDDIPIKGRKKGKA